MNEPDHIAILTTIHATGRSFARLHIQYLSVILNSEEIRPTLVITVVIDTLLFVTMLVGLFPLLTDRSCPFGIGRLLWKQVGFGMSTLC